MRTRIIALCLGLMSLASYAQKSEIKAAEKAIKKQDYGAAMSALSTAKGMISNMDDKYKARYYNAQFMVNAAKKNYLMAAEAYKNLLAVEKTMKTDRYSSDAQPMMNNLIQEVNTRAMKLFQEDKNYKAAAKDFYLVYQLSPSDTSMVNNAALSAYNAKDLETALKYYLELKDLGYTGIQTIYYATEVATGQEKNLGDKDRRDLMVKTKQFEKPRDEVSASKRGEIVKNIALIYSELGKNEEAVAVIKEVRKNNPDDLSLLLTEANFYFQLNQMDKFGDLMKRAVELDPKNPALFYNLGIINSDKEGKKEEALGYFKKAIELKPDYADAYIYIYRLIISEEEKINKEMEGLTDFDKYDELQAKKKDIYKRGLPYLEKADSFKRTVETVKVLRSIYEILGNTEKAKEYDGILSKMQG